jgi:hypothetical protein
MKLKTFRIFCDDAAPFFTCSGYGDVRATDERAAIDGLKNKPEWISQWVAIEWPPNADGQAWLDRNLPPEVI